MSLSRARAKKGRKESALEVQPKTCHAQPSRAWSNKSSTNKCQKFSINWFQSKLSKNQKTHKLCIYVCSAMVVAPLQLLEFATSALCAKISTIALSAKKLKFMITPSLRSERLTVHHQWWSQFWMKPPPQKSNQNPSHDMVAEADAITKNIQSKLWLVNLLESWVLIVKTRKMSGSKFMIWRKNSAKACARKIAKARASISYSAQYSCRSSTRLLSANPAKSSSQW